MIDIVSLYESLIDASWRGVNFCMPDSRQEVGRRVQRWLFPGRDDKVFEDLGSHDGPFSISGIIIGDDYVSRAQDMVQALRTPGSGVLVHPWLGRMVVILTQPGTVSFSQTEFRVARFTATFELYQTPQPAVLDTLTQVLSCISDLRNQARSMLATALAPIAAGAAAIGTVESVLSQAAGWFTIAIGSIGGAIASAAAPPLAGLSNAGIVPLDANYGGAIADLLAAPSSAIAATSAPLLPAAIGPGDMAPPATPVDPTVTTTVLVAVAAAALAPSPAAVAPGPIITLTLAAYVLADAVEAGTDLTFASQQDAQTWVATITGQIDACSTLAVSLAPAQPSAVAPVWRALLATRAAVVADSGAILGRLPVVTEVTTQISLPAWWIAQALSGDNPAQLLAVYTDLVARNGIRNPGLVAAGTLETLQSAA